MQTYLGSLYANDFNKYAADVGSARRCQQAARTWPTVKVYCVRVINLVADDDQFFVVCEAATADERRFRNIEILKISNEQVAEVQVYFGWSLPHKAAPGASTDS